jgi:hypothetical protein
MSLSNCVIDIVSECLDDIYDQVWISQGIDAGPIPSLNRTIELYIYAPKCRCLCQNVVNGATNINVTFIDINGNFPYTLGTSISWYPFYYPISNNYAICNDPNFQNFENCFYIDDLNIIPIPFAVAGLNLQRISYGQSIFYYSVMHNNAYNSDYGVWFFVELYSDFTNNYMFLVITTVTFTSCRKFFINVDIFNTKEDEEVLKGLFIGNYAYEEHHDSHIIKNAKMVDLL